jgi:hypothetical protein
MYISVGNIHVSWYWITDQNYVNVIKNHLKLCIFICESEQIVYKIACI